MQIFWKILVYASTGYLALCLVVFIFQRKMLYLPHQTQFPEKSASNEGLRHWPSYEHFRGFVTQDEWIDPEGTIVIFHGNAGTAFHRSFYGQALSRQKYRVILAEYPGYGSRDGRPSEKVLVNDALETIRLAYQEFGEPLILWGESLGCGVVSGAVSKTSIPIKGLVLFLPWDTLSDLAQTHYWYFPTRLLVLEKYNNIENLRGYAGKIAVLLAEYDEVVPVQHGKNLYESLTVEKKLWIFENARHNEVPIAPQLRWWQEVTEFISNDD